MNTPKDDAGRLERRVGLLPCPKCGSINSSEEATGAIEIEGVCYQDCWIQCNDCGFEGPTIKISDDLSLNYQAVRDAWNNAHNA